MITSSSIIEQRYKLSRQEFISNYVNKSKPVIISRLIQAWDAFGKWSLDFLQKTAYKLNINTKEFVYNKIKNKCFTLKEYAEFIEEFEIRNKFKKDIKALPYCHAIPLFSLVTILIRDVQFPIECLLKWYVDQWWHYCQFFIRLSNSVTPLHFDYLLTNNLFFQIVGRKQFTRFFIFS